MGWTNSFFEVDMSRVQNPPVDPDWQSTKNSYTRQDVENWVRQLSDVQRLSREKGYGYEDFQRMRSSADPQEQALGKTHHKFYDHDSTGPATNRDHVSMMWNGESFEVSENGNHRVHAAKNIGLGTMPAEVSSQEEFMEECQKHGRKSNLLMPKDRGVDERVSQNTQGASPAAPQASAAPTRPLWERGSEAEPVRKDRIGR